MITSLLDSDLYKFSQMQIAWSQFPDAEVEYKFKCRNKVDLKPYGKEIYNELESLTRLRFQPEELNYLRSLNIFKDGFINNLSNFKFNSNSLKVDNSGDELDIRIKGNWYQTILWEVPLLATINEVYFKNLYINNSIKSKMDILKEGYDILNYQYSFLKNKTYSNFKLVEFGTRRRFSQYWQEEVICKLKESEKLIGTSNLDLARRYDLIPIGTMAHEYLQVCQAYAPLKDFQKFAFDKWMLEFRGKLGIALTDIIGIDCFLKSFDLLHAKAYDGMRQDSGDPYKWCEKVIEYYINKGIDPKTKTAIFSDGLNIEDANLLHIEFNERINCVFGIGTSLTNNFMSHSPLNVVMKLVKCNGQPVAKLSDSQGKQMCEDELFVKALQKFAMDV